MFESSHDHPHFELRARVPFGTAFMFCFIDATGATIAQFVLAARYARLVCVLQDAANDGECAREWCGFMTADEIGRKYSALSGTEKPLGVGGVRALVFELRRLIKQNFAAVDGGPKLIETKKLLGYRIAPGMLTVTGR